MAAVSVLVGVPGLFFLINCAGTTALEPFLVPIVLVGVGLYLLIERQ